MKSACMALALFTFVLGFFVAGWQLGQDPRVLHPAAPGPERGGAHVDRQTGVVDALRWQDRRAPVRGRTDAPVTIVAFADFQCPFSARASALLARLRADYPGDLRIVLKHFPAGFHPRAMDAHRAAIAAGEQGRFWEMYDRIFESRDRLDRAALFDHARALGLELAAFEEAFASPDTVAQIAADRALGVALGVRRTPRFYVGGRPLDRPPTYTALQRSIEIELARRRSVAPAQQVADAGPVSR